VLLFFYSFTPSGEGIDGMNGIKLTSIENFRVLFYSENNRDYADLYMILICVIPVENFHGYW
jgi:hypothetical protein